MATMLAHVQGLSVAFRDAARKVDGPTTSTPPQAAPKDLARGWRDEMPVALDELVAGLAGAGRPGRRDDGRRSDHARRDHAGRGQQRAGACTPGTWPRPPGSRTPSRPENLEASWQMVSNTPDEPEAREGLFGPRLPIADDAPLLDRSSPTPAGTPTGRSLSQRCGLSSSVRPDACPSADHASQNAFLRQARGQTDAAVATGSGATRPQAQRITPRLGCPGSPRWRPGRRCRRRWTGTSSRRRR